MYSALPYDVMKSHLTRMNSLWLYYIKNKGCYVIKIYHIYTLSARYNPLFNLMPNIATDDFKVAWIRDLGSVYRLRC